MLSQTSQTPKVSNHWGCKLSWQHSKQKALGVLKTFSLFKLIDHSTITECQDPKVRREQLLCPPLMTFLQASLFWERFWRKFRPQIIQQNLPTWKWYFWCYKHRGWELTPLVYRYTYRYRQIIYIHMPSRILIRYRFTNERLPYSIETIGLPRLAC